MLLRNTNKKIIKAFILGYTTIAWIQATNWKLRCLQQWREDAKKQTKNSKLKMSSGKAHNIKYVKSTNLRQQGAVLTLKIFKLKKHQPTKSMLLSTVVYCITNEYSTSPFHQSRGYEYQPLSTSRKVADSWFRMSLSTWQKDYSK